MERVFLRRDYRNKRVSIKLHHLIERRVTNWLLRSESLRSKGRARMHPGGAGGGSVHQLLLAETIYMYVCESEPIVDSCERVAVACRGPAAVRCSAGCRRAVSGSPGRLRTGFSRGDDARRTMGRRVRVLGQTVEKKDSRELVDHDVVSGLKLNIKKYLSLVFFPSSSGFADAPHPSDRPAGTARRKC